MHMTVQLPGDRDRVAWRKWCELVIPVGQLRLLSLQLRELGTENTSLKGQLVTLEETVNVHEMEAKASRETIVRLVSQVNREQKRAASCAEERDRLQQVQQEARVRLWHVLMWEQKLETGCR